LFQWTFGNITFGLILCLYGFTAAIIFSITCSIKIGFNPKDKRAFASILYLCDSFSILGLLMCLILTLVCFAISFAMSIIGYFSVNWLNTLYSPFFAGFFIAISKHSNVFLI